MTVKHIGLEINGGFISNDRETTIRWMDVLIEFGIIFEVIVKRDRFDRPIFIFLVEASEKQLKKLIDEYGFLNYFPT